MFIRLWTRLQRHPINFSYRLTRVTLTKVTYTTKVQLCVFANGMKNIPKMLENLITDLFIYNVKNIVFFFNIILSIHLIK